MKPRYHGEAVNGITAREEFQNLVLDLGLQARPRFSLAYSAGRAGADISQRVVAAINAEKFFGHPAKSNAAGGTLVGLPGADQDR
jgi:hypothetical protein